MFLGKKPVRIRMPRCAALTSNTPLQCARHIALKTARLSDEGSPLEGMHAAAPAHANARYASVRHSPLLCAEIQRGNSVRTLRTDKCAALATSVRTSMPRCTALMRQARIQRGSLHALQRHRVSVQHAPHQFTDIRCDNSVRNRSAEECAARPRARTVGVPSN